MDIFEDAVELASWQDVEQMRNILDDMEWEVLDCRGNKEKKKEWMLTQEAVFAELLRRLRLKRQ